MTTCNSQWHSAAFPGLQPLRLTCPYHDMATYIALVSHKDPYTTPLFCFSNGCLLTTLRLLKHLHCQLQWAGYHPHRYNTHSFQIGGATSAAEAGPYKQPFSSWADGIARHTSTTSQSTSPVQMHCNCGQHLSLKHKHRNRQQATLQVAAPINDIHALSRTETQVAAHKHIHTLYCVSL